MFISFIYSNNYICICYIYTEELYDSIGLTHGLPRFAKASIPDRIDFGAAFKVC